MLRLAVQMFCYQLRKQIGAFAAALGGLDLLVFTGGIGERAAPVRWETCSGLDHLGIKLDRDRNDVSADKISADNSQCLVRVIPTNEDLMIEGPTSALGEIHFFDPDKVLLDPYARSLFFPPDFRRSASIGRGSNAGRTPVGTLPVETPSV